MIKRFVRSGLAGAVALATLGLVGGNASDAAEVTLRVHHFLPPPSVAHSKFIEPWAKKVEAESGGRIEVQIYPAMSLGGKPPQLFDQVKDGVADVVWTVTGYTAGRFPTVEAFELPFIPGTAEATSQALWEFYEKYAKDEFADVHPITFHTHAPGAFHMKDKPITSIEDLAGTKVRAPTRVINNALKELGATPVGMPVPQVPEALSKGVVDGAVLPYEVTLPLKVHEMVGFHSEIGGDRGLYTTVFLFGMNKAKYESLPDDLKKVIDDNSGLALAKQTGATWDAAEQPGRDKAAERGNKFNTISPEDVVRWKEKTQPVVDEWVAQMDKAGKDGKAMLEDAQAMIAKYSK